MGIRRGNRLAVTMRGAIWLGCCALLGACGDDDGGGNQNANQACPAGHQAQGPACVPVFDDCPGVAEIPILGGGCRPVGVTDCATGFESDGGGGCEPILPAAPCGLDTMPVIGLTECQPVGVRECAVGFVTDGAGGCEPILPVDPCGPDTMPVIGQASCQPIGDCGPGPWGSVTPDATAVFVDASYPGGGSDGSETAPFLSIVEALQVAPDGAQVIVAAGTYDATLLIDRPVRLRGRCASMVAIDAVDATAVTIAGGGSGSAISGFSITAPGSGVLVDGAFGIALERLHVIDTGFEGIRIRGAAEVTLSDSLVSGAKAYGLFASGSTVTVERSVLRDGQPLPDQSLGIGVAVKCEPDGVCGGFTMTDSVVSGNTDTGVYVAGVEAEILSSVIRDTASTPAEGVTGYGIFFHCDIVQEICHPLSIRQCFVSGNTDAGIGIIGPPASVHATTIRDNHSVPETQEGGWGIFAQCSYYVHGACGDITVTESLVTDNQETGIGSLGSSLYVSGTIVRNTRSADNGTQGRGILGQCYLYDEVCGELHVTDSLVESNDEAGIVSGGAFLTVTRSVVRYTQPQQADDMAGLGIAAVVYPVAGWRGRLEMSQTLVEGNRTSGLYVIGTDAVITASVVRDTLSRLADDDGGMGLTFQCDPVFEVCGNLEIHGSLFERNTRLGVAISTGDATITSTVVRDTLPDPRGDGGRGIAAWCHPPLGVCGTLDLRDSLLEGNRDMGVLVTGVDATVSGLLVRGTLPRLGDGLYGRGFETHCSPEADVCASLDLSDSLFEGNHNIGVMLTGVTATVSGVRVVGTMPDDQGDWQGDFGQGFYVSCDLAVEECGSLEMVGCQVGDSYTAGIAVVGVSGSITSSRIEQVWPRPLDDSFGYGVQVASQEGTLPGAVDIDSCEIVDASLAGILYHLTRGTVRRTAIRGGNFSVVMNPGASPTIEDNNLLTGLAQDEPTWINLEPGPAPAPAMPTSLF